VGTSQELISVSASILDKQVASYYSKKQKKAICFISFKLYWYWIIKNP
jgi:hypothetical protein